jgi:hypothetical protein
MELLVVKLVTALALVAVSLMNPDARIATGLMAVALLVQLLLMKQRSVYGLDGADQMYVVVFLGLAVYELMPQGSLASAAGLIYIGAPTVLSYLIAGCVKIAGPSWRDGTAIGGIMTTKIYGNSAAAAVLQGRAAGVLFHAANTALMGLNSFFMAFVASYPAVAYVNELMHRLGF